MNNTQGGNVTFAIHKGGETDQEANEDVMEVTDHLSRSEDAHKDLSRQSSERKFGISSSVENYENYHRKESTPEQDPSPSQ